MLRQPPQGSINAAQASNKADKGGTPPFLSMTYIAHMGFSDRYPESTIPGLRASKRYGYPISETNVHITSDGYFVVIHDTTVDRTTDGTGTIANMTLAEIKALNIDVFPIADQTRAGLKVPTLEEWFEASIELNIAPMIELANISEARVASFLSIVRKYNLEEVVFVESTSLSVCTYLRNQSKRIKITPMLNLTESNVDICRSLGPNTYIATGYTYLTQELIAYAHSKDVKVISYIVNDANTSRQYEKLGLDYLITGKLMQNNFIDTQCVLTTIANGNTSLSQASGSVIGLDVVEFECELYYTVAKPVVSVCGVTYIVDDGDGEWQVIRYRTFSRGANVTITAGGGGTVEWMNAKIRCYKI